MKTPTSKKRKGIQEFPDFPSFAQWYESKRQYLISYYESLAKNPQSLLFPSEELELEFAAFRRNPQLSYMFEKMMYDTRYKK